MEDMYEGTRMEHHRHARLRLAGLCGVDTCIPSWHSYAPREQHDSLTGLLLSKAAPMLVTPS